MSCADFNRNDAFLRSSSMLPMRAFAELLSTIDRNFRCSYAASKPGKAAPVNNGDRVNAPHTLRTWHLSVQIFFEQACLAKFAYSVHNCQVCDAAVLSSAFSTDLAVRLSRCWLQCSRDTLAVVLDRSYLSQQRYVWLLLPHSEQPGVAAMPQRNGLASDSRANRQTYLRNHPEGLRAARHDASRHHKVSCPFYLDK